MEKSAWQRNVEQSAAPFALIPLGLFIPNPIVKSGSAAWADGGEGRVHSWRGGNTVPATPAVLMGKSSSCRICNKGRGCRWERYKGRRAGRAAGSQVCGCRAALLPHYWRVPVPFSQGAQAPARPLAPQLSHCQSASGNKQSCMLCWGSSLRASR